MADTLRVAYIGESVSAMGFAQAGAAIHLPPVEAEQVWAACESARKAADLVILNRAHAQVIRERLGVLLREHPLPPVLVLPGMDGEEPFEHGLTRDARRALGLPRTATTPRAVVE